MLAAERNPARKSGIPPLPSQHGRRRRLPVLLSLLGGACAILIVAIGSARDSGSVARAPAPSPSEPASLLVQRTYPSSSGEPADPRGARVFAETRGRSPEMRPLEPGMPAEKQTHVLVSGELDELRRSGAPNGTLTANALRAVEGLKQIPALAGAEFTEFKCFGDGCAVTITNQSPVTGQAVLMSRQFMEWPGRKFISGPLSLESGQTQNVLVLHTPKHDEVPQPAGK
jgi:hypothetical protein